MNAAVLLAVAGVALSVTVVGTGVFLYRAGKAGRQVTFVKEGTMQFIHAGEDLHRIYLNSDGYVLTTAGEIKKESELLRGEDTDEAFSFFGLHYVGASYPWYKVDEFEISKDTLLPENTVAEEAPLRTRMKHEVVPVKELRHIFPHPVYIEGAETDDGAEPNLIIQLKVRVVFPKIARYQIGKQFFPTLDAAASASVIAYMSTQDTYSSFMRNENKSAELFAILQTLNESLKSEIGVVIDNATIVKYALPEREKAFRDATKAKQIATLKGQAELEAATYDKQAAIERAKGRIADAKEFIKVFKKNPALARYYSDQVTTRHLGQGSNLRTLVYGGGGTSVQVADDRSDPAPATTPTPTTTTGSGGPGTPSAAPTPPPTPPHPPAPAGGGGGRRGRGRRGGP